MPIVRLEPSSTIEFTGSGVIGAATAHEALSDASDASYCQYQVSEFEPFKLARGNLTDLPEGAGVVLGTIINVRAALAPPGPPESGRLASGDHPTERLTNQLIETITDYATASLDLGTPAVLNAAQYMAGINYWNSNGTLRIYRMNFDVDFNYVSGVGVAMIFQWLGPLVAVGLHEMPRLALELWRRSRTMLRPDELEAAWLEMRDHRARHHFILARPVGQ